MAVAVRPRGMSQELLSFGKNYHIYDVISFQKCSFRNFHMCCVFFSDLSFSGTIIFDAVSFQQFSFSGTFTFHVFFFQMCSVSGRIAFDMVFFSFQVTLETGAAFLFGLLRGRLRCNICLLTI